MPVQQLRQRVNCTETAAMTMQKNVTQTQGERVPITACLEQMPN